MSSTGSGGASGRGRQRRPPRVAGRPRPGQQTQEGHSGRTTLAGWLRRHRKGIVAALGTALGLVLTAIGLQFSLMSFSQDRSSAELESSADLKIVSVNLDGRAAATNAAGELPEANVTFSDELNLVLRNRGGQAALVTQVSARVIRSTSLGDCLGPTDALAPADYDILIPTEPNSDQSPVMLSTEVNVAVEGGTTNELSISIGPDELAANSVGYVAEVEVELRLADGPVLPVGRIGLVSRANVSALYGVLDSVEAGCLDSALAIAHSYAENSAAQSSSLSAIIEALSKPRYLPDTASPPVEINSTVAVVRAEVVNREDVPVATNATEDATTPVGVIADALDVVLRNRGSETALITHIEATIIRSDELGQCFGAGDVPISAAYDVVLPGEIANQSMPTRTAVDTTFAVAGGAVDRLAVSVGPAQLGSSAVGFVAEVEFTLRFDDGSALPIGTFALLSRGNTAGIEGGDAELIPGCLARAFALVSSYANSDVVASPGLSAMITAFASR